MAKSKKTPPKKQAPASAAGQSSGEYLQAYELNQANFQQGYSLLQQRAFPGIVAAAVLTNNKILLEFIEKQKIKANITKWFAVALIAVESDSNIETTRYIVKKFNPDITNKSLEANGELLLHRASRAGASKTVELLLEVSKGKDVDALCEASTPLHYALSRGHKSTAEIILKHNPNLFLQPKGGLSALQIIGAMENSSKFISLKSLLCSKYKTTEPEYKSELRRCMADSGYQQMKQSVSLKPLVSEASKVTAAYYETKAAFFEVFANPSSESCAKFIHLTELAIKNIEDLSLLKRVTEELVAFCHILKEPCNQKILKLLKLAAPKIEGSDYLVRFYNDSSAKSLEQGKYKEAIAYCKESVQHLTEQCDDTIKYYVYLNYGSAYKFLDTEQSLVYFLEAQKFIPKEGDDALATELYDAYYNSNKFVEANAQLSKIKNLDLEYLTSIQIKAKTGEVFDLSSALERIANIEKSGSFFIRANEAKAEVYKSQKQHEDARSCYLAIMASEVKKESYSQLQKYTAAILELFYQEENWDCGYKFLEEQYKKFPTLFDKHDHIGLKYYEFFFYQSASDPRADKVLNDVRDIAKSGSKREVYVMNHLHKYSFFKAIEEGKLQIAKDLLPRVVEESVPWLEMLLQYASMQHEAQQLGKEVETTAASLELLESAAKEDDSSDGELETSVAIDPKEFHRFCQEQKQLMLKQKYSDLGNKQPQDSISWSYDGASYNSADTGVVVKHPFKDIYFAIDPKLQDETGKYARVLHKGLAPRAQNAEGIKQIGEIFELKLLGSLGGDRPVANKVIRNSIQGKCHYLYIFDEVKTHVAVKTMSHKASVINSGGLDLLRVEDSVAADQNQFFDDVVLVGGAD